MLLLPALAGLLLAASDGTAAADGPSSSVRSQALVDLSFEESGAEVPDRAQMGKSRDNGRLVNSPRRVPSPFWNQRTRKAVAFNALRKQYLRLPDSPDLDRQGAVTVSFFFLNLHPAGDGATHGILAKRAAGRAGRTNYGINYVPRADSLRPYINDGSGFRFPEFSLQQVAGSRRLVYLTATFEVGDAPAPDADTDKDDVLIRLYVNGKQVRPKRPVRVSLAGNDAWATDVNLKGLLNNVPLILGATTENSEFASCLFDEFTLFDRALSPSEVARLFKEVAGPHAEQLAAEELKPPRSPAPLITGVSQSGLQIAGTTRLVITGQNLGERPLVHLPIWGLKQRMEKGSNAGRVIVELRIPDSTPAALYPLRVQTESGLSNTLPLAVDHLPQRLVSQATREKPAALPAAFSGTISGASRERIYFRGRAGQRLVADVETRRFGSALEPVVEIKTSRGTPLAIAWGTSSLQGDARAETTLPADGLYFVELHDLMFRAAGQSRFRIKVGSLKLVDAWFPPAVPRGRQTSLRPLGSGVSDEDVVTVDARQRRSSELFLPADAAVFAGPLPPVKISDAAEFVEPVGNKKTLLTVDANSSAGKEQPLFINGRISRPAEVDHYRVNVAAGSQLRLLVLGPSIKSPLHAAVTVRALPGNAVLAQQEHQPGMSDLSFPLNVPPQVRQIDVAVRDAFHRGGDGFVYRLRIAPPRTADFNLSVTAAQLNLPAGGAGFLQLQVNRSGYNGPVHLHLEGTDELTVLPQTIPAGRAGRVFVTVRHNGRGAVGLLDGVRLVGESAGRGPVVRRVARYAASTTAIAGWENDLPVVITPAAPFAVRPTQLPPALFKGDIQQLAVELKRPPSLSEFAVRLSLVSTERPRLKNPKNPKQGNKPRVRSLPGQSIPAGAATGRLAVAVPLDTAEAEIEFVLRAELVPHAYSDRALATVYSQPFRLPVKNALALSVEGASLSLTGGQRGLVRGRVKRSAGFRRPVTLLLSGLPKGYATQPVVVPAEKETFALPVSVPPESKPRSLQNITLSVRAAGQRALLPNRQMTLTVKPAPKKPAPPATRK